MLTEITEIRACDVRKCSYNRKGRCHAVAINVGSPRPLCDAFVESEVKCGTSETVSGVGACKMKECRFNDCLNCSAPRIVVRLHGDQALCETFETR